MNIVFILYAPRSGAGLLGNILRQDPMVHCLPEASDVLFTLKAVADEEGHTNGEKSRQAFAEWAGDFPTLVVPILKFGTWDLAGQGWNEAVEALSWLLRTWPDATAIVLQRPVKDATSSMERSWPLWVGSYDRTIGAAARRMLQHQQYLADFAEMTPSRSRVLHYSDLFKPEASGEILRNLGIEVDPAAWDSVLLEGPPPEDFPPLERTIREERRAELELAALERMRKYTAQQTGRPLEAVQLRLPQRIELESLKPDPVITYVPQPPRRTFPVFPEPPDGAPSLSISIMAHPSRAKWVQELLVTLGDSTPVSWDNGIGLIQNAAESWKLHDPAADYHLVLQDDTILCDDFVGEVRRFLQTLKEPSVVSFFHSSRRQHREQALAALKLGLDRITGNIIPGPAICIPTAWIGDMLSFYATSKSDQDDNRISYWLSSKDKDCVFPLPCLVDHRAGESLAGNGHRGPRPAVVFEKTRRIVVPGMEDAPRAIFYQWLSVAARWDELKYSLRSVLEMFEDKECPIYLIADAAPEWYVEGTRLKLIIIPEYRRSRHLGRWRARQIGLQCAEDILQMYDDIYFVKPLGWDDFDVGLSDGVLSGKEDGYIASERQWLCGMAAASMDLRKAGIPMPILRFSTHTPYKWDRRRMQRILNSYFINHRGSEENLYFNTYRPEIIRHPEPWRCSSLPAGPDARYYNHRSSGPDNESRAELRRMFPDMAPWEGRVPKIIHQTWKNHDIPRDVYPEAWTQSWKDLHPTWDYMFWTDSDLQVFANEHYPDFQQLFMDARGVIKADVGRLLVLYHFGGLYADLDYVALKPMDPLVEGDSLFVSTMPNDYTHNALIACMKGHPAMLKAAEEALKRWERDHYNTPEWTSGPDMFSGVIRGFRPVRWDPRLVCPIDWRIEQPADLEQLPPEERFPDAFAVTYWRHNW